MIFNLIFLNDKKLRRELHAIIYSTSENESNIFRIELDQTMWNIGTANSKKEQVTPSGEKIDKKCSTSLQLLMTDETGHYTKCRSL